MSESQTKPSTDSSPGSNIPLPLKQLLYNIWRVFIQPGIQPCMLDPGRIMKLVFFPCVFIFGRDIQQAFRNQKYQTTAVGQWLTLIR